MAPWRLLPVLSGLALLLRGSLSFQCPTPTNKTKKQKIPSLLAEKLRPGSLEAATAELGRVPYGESSRKYRRTVFTHDDWLVHRSNDRLVGNLISMFYSGVVRQVKNKILLVSAVGFFVTFWNDALPQIYGSSLPHLCLPTLPFVLSSPALGLLLVFRTNASYQRWLEGRLRWGLIVSHSKNMIRMSSTFADASTDEGKKALDDLAVAVWAISRSLMNTLSGPEDIEEYEAQLQKVCCEGSDRDETLPNRLLGAPDRVSAALLEASLVLDMIPVDEKRRVEIDKSLVILGDSLSSCNRIFSSPVPLVYTRHTARFLSLWMLLLPFAIHDEFVKADQLGLPTLPAVAILALFLFGIEELAVQLEEPFSILPMQKFCDEIMDSSKAMIDWSIESRSARKI